MVIAVAIKENVSTSKRIRILFFIGVVIVSIQSAIAQFAKIEITF